MCSKCNEPCHPFFNENYKFYEDYFNPFVEAQPFLKVVPLWPFKGRRGQTLELDLY